LTAASWLLYADPADRMTFLHPRVSERKLRLCGCHCCRRCWDLLSPEGQHALSVTEQFLEGQASDAERQAAFRALIETSGGYIGPHPPGRPWTTASLPSDFFTCALALVIATNGEFLCSVESGREIGETYEDMKQVIRVGESCRMLRWLAADEARRQQDAARGTIGRVWNRLLRASGRRDSLREQEIAHQAALVVEVFGEPYWPANFAPEWRTDTAVLLARQMYEIREFSAMPILADALQDAGCDSDDILNHCREPGEHVRGCWVVDLVLGKS
jgi:hypothetical protein